MSVNNWLSEIDDLPIRIIGLRFHMVNNSGERDYFWTVQYYRYGFKSPWQEVSSARAHKLMRYFQNNYHADRFGPACTAMTQASDYHHSYAGKSNRMYLDWEL